MCSINPSFVLGPPATDRNDGVSIEFALNLLRTGELTLRGFPCVDVRDVAKAHIACCVNENSGGRYILSSTFGVENWFAYEKLQVADSVGGGILLPNLQSVEKKKGAQLRDIFDNSKVQSTEDQGLGISLIPLEDTLVDMITTMKETHAAYL